MTVRTRRPPWQPSRAIGDLERYGILALAAGLLLGVGYFLESVLGSTAPAQSARFLSSALAHPSSCQPSHSTPWRISRHMASGNTAATGMEPVQVNVTRSSSGSSSTVCSAASSS